MPFVLCYTRTPIDNVYYDPRLAYSVHFAVSQDGHTFTPLNHNSGILFAKATENPDGSLNPKTLKKPVLTCDSQGFHVAAIRCGPEGEDEAETFPNALLFHSQDLIDFSEPQEISPAEYQKLEDSFCKAPEADAVKDIEGIVAGNMMEVSPAVYERLTKKLGERRNIAIELDETYTVRSIEDIRNIKAVARYSDGTWANKKVEWNLSTFNPLSKEPQKIKGKVFRQHFQFPMAYDRADPDMCRWNGKYYFIATNDADQNHTLYIREADSIPGLVDAPEHLLLDSSTYEGIGGLLWAPEFHEINGRLYIFHAATPGEFFWEESHIMELKEGGNPINRNDWSAPKRVCRKDGTDICKAGKEITLDMTCFQWEGEFYAIWSQRQFLPKDLGAWLYIAKLNPDEPWKLLSDPVILSKPDYGWANNHTFVDEGPFALMQDGDDRLFITFSSAAVDTSYVVGLLQIKKGQDLLVRENWKKTGYPLLTSRSMPGEFGTGHNAYVIDEEGEIWNTYHARPGTDAPRSSGVRRVHFDIDGEPVLDLTEDRDVADELREVEITVRVV